MRALTYNYQEPTLLKSEVAIAPLFCQIQQPDIFLLEVKTITKSPENGIAESVKSCNLHKKGRIENDFKGQIASRIQFRPTNIAYKLMFAIKNYQ